MFSSWRFVVAETRARDTADINATVALKANIASPTFTGTPAAPTAAAGTNTTQIATTEFANAAGGLVHINTTTFSAASSVSINSVFSATYDNYRIAVTIPTSNAQSNSVLWRLRKSGTDSSSGYYFGGWVVTSAGGTSAFSGSNAAQLELGQTTGSSRVNSAYIDVSLPFAVARTGFYANVQSMTDVAYIRPVGGVHDVGESYDGFSLVAFTGTITGTVITYGYKNS